MKRLLSVFVVSLMILGSVTGSTLAQKLSGEEIKAVYPGSWKLTTKKGAKGTITFKRDGSGRMKIGSYKSPIIWNVKGSKLCVTRETSKGMKETCSSSTKIGPRKYRSSNGTVIYK